MRFISHPAAVLFVLVHTGTLLSYGMEESSFDEIHGIAREISGKSAEEAKKSYIDLQVSKTLFDEPPQSHNKRIQSLEKSVDKFLERNSGTPLLVVMGPPGSGKTTYANFLESKLSPNEAGWTPVSLSFSDIPTEGINKALQEKNRDIQQLKKSKTIFILDDYDKAREVFKNVNVYEKLGLKEWKNAKTIFLLDSDTVNETEVGVYFSTGHRNPPDVKYIMPLSENKQRSFFDKWVDSSDEKDIDAVTSFDEIKKFYKDLTPLFHRPKLLKEILNCTRRSMTKDHIVDNLSKLDSDEGGRYTKLIENIKHIKIKNKYHKNLLESKESADIKELQASVKVNVKGLEGWSYRYETGDWKEVERLKEVLLKTWRSARGNNEKCANLLKFMNDLGHYLTLIEEVNEEALEVFKDVINFMKVDESKYKNELIRSYTWALWASDKVNTEYLKNVQKLVETESEEHLQIISNVIPKLKTEQFKKYIGMTLHELMQKMDNHEFKCRDLIYARLSNNIACNTNITKYYEDAVKHAEKSFAPGHKEMNTIISNYPIYSNSNSLYKRITSLTVRMRNFLDYSIMSTAPRNSQWEMKDSQQDDWTHIINTSNCRKARVKNSQKGLVDSNKYRESIVPGNSQKAKDSQKELWKVEDLQQADYYKSIADQN
ncbi:MAG: AAA family ATPase, partial [Spirochaetota bacterium]